MHRHATMLLALAAAFSCIARGANAQRTWIVDASRGPGTTHTDIQPAVDAASDGDTILVRKGTYKRFQTTKALRILGRPGALVDVPRTTPFPRVGVTIQGIGRGRTMVLKGLEIRVFPMFRAHAVQVLGCKGLVHLDRLVIPSYCYRSGVAARCQPGILIDQSDQVLLSDSVVRAKDALSATSSTVVVCRSTLRGQDSLVTRWRALPGSPALVLTGSRVTLSRVQATGGQGGRSTNTISSQPAIRATGGRVTIAGLAPDAIAAGKPAPGQGSPTPAIVMSGGSLWLSAAVRLVPNPGAPGVSGPHTRIQGTPVALCAQGAPPGGVVRVEAVATAGETVYLLLAFPAPPRQTAWGSLWLDPASMALLGSTRLGTPPVWSRSVPVPPIPALRGLSVGFQALSGIPGSPTAPERLSNGAVVVLD